MRSERVCECASDEQWKRNKCKQREFRIPTEHHRQHDHYLQNGDDTLLDSVDQHSLHRVHVLDDARHQVARGAIVEPAQRQQLNVEIQVAAQIKNDFLLERVVQSNSQRIEKMLNKESDSRNCN